MAKAESYFTPYQMQVLAYLETQPNGTVYDKSGIAGTKTLLGAGFDRGPSGDLPGSTITSLERKGWVSRTVSGRRTFQVRITSKGLAALRTHRKKLRSEPIRHGEPFDPKGTKRRVKRATPRTTPRTATPAPTAAPAPASTNGHRPHMEDLPLVELVDLLFPDGIPARALLDPSVLSALQDFGQAYSTLADKMAAAG